MSRILSKALPGLARQVPTVLVLAALVALGWWGAVCDWKLKEMFPWLPHRPEAPPKKAEEKPTNPAVSPGEVELDSDNTARQAGIATSGAQQQAVSHIVSAPGVLAFDQTRYAQLGARVSGTAWRVYATTGQHVRKGDVLALVVAAEAGKGRADFLTAWVQHDVKARQVARLEAAGNSIPERQIRDARMLLREARLQMLNAHQALANLGLTLSLDSLKELTDEQVSQRVRLLGLPAELHSEPDLPASLLPIQAPFDGLVIRRDLVQGEMTGPGQTAFVLADIRRLWLQMDIRQEDVERLAIGQTVSFHSTTGGPTASGELTWISAEVDPKTRTIKANAIVDNSKGRLRPATFGQVEVLVGAASGVTVPDESVQWDGKSRWVFVRIDDKSFQPRLVLTGTSRKNRTELLDTRTVLAAGLAGQAGGPGGVVGMLGGIVAGMELLVPIAAGEKVATTGSHLLKSEMLKSQIKSED